MRKGKKKPQLNSPGRIPDRSDWLAFSLMKMADSQPAVNNRLQATRKSCALEPWVGPQRYSIHPLTACSHKATLYGMIEIRKTEFFIKWLDGLYDIRARARVLARIERLAAGNPGDVAPVGEGVSELRNDYGPGYRVYYRQFGEFLVILLAGGDKQTQTKDIKTL
jgi:putative addiction module killer protein